MNVFLKWEELDFRKRSGKEKMRCPACDGQRSDKKDKSLMINHNDGYGKCFYCDALAFRDQEEKPEYQLPRQDWKNYTKLSDAMIKYLEGRKIPQSAVIELGWSEEKHYQPAHGKEVNNLVYNFFEGEKVVNKKYRSGAKKFTQSKDGKPVLYNINSIIDCEQAWIVEGEMDVAALYAVGIKSVVSVPNGANDNDNYWINSQRYVQGVKRFVIAVDCDTKGIMLREKIAQRLGRWRCGFVEWEGKDANDDLISGALEQSVKNIQNFPVNSTFTIFDLFDGVDDLYANGLPKTIYPRSADFGNLKEIFSVMRGQLTVVTGIPSHGKSAFNDWYVMNLLRDYDLKGSWFSPEHWPLELYQVNFIEKATGLNFWGKHNGESVPRLTKDDIKKYAEWAGSRLYFTDAEGGNVPTWDWIFEKFKEQMFAFGIDIFVIDAFNKILLPKGDERQAIRHVLTELTAFAQANNVLIFLVAHPTKMRKGEDGKTAAPSLYDVSGSADFRNMTHNGYTVYRDFETGRTQIINGKTKFNFQGKLGEMVEFKWNGINQRYYTENPNYDSFLPGDPEPRNIEINDKIDELPF